MYYHIEMKTHGMDFDEAVGGTGWCWSKLVGKLAGFRLSLYSLHVLDRDVDVKIHPYNTAIQLQSLKKYRVWVKKGMEMARV